MNKSDLVKELAVSMDFTQSKAQDVVEKFISIF